MNYLNKLKNKFEGKIQTINLVLFSILSFQLLFSINFILAIVNEFYYQYPMATILSFLPNDPPGYVPLEIYLDEIWGVHFFGDYLLTFHWSQLPNPWLTSDPVNYPPIAIEIIGLFKFFDYGLGLKIYLIFLLLSLLSPFLFLFYKFRSVTYFILIFSIGFLNLPFLVTLDRGNLIGLIPAISFFAGICLLRSKYHIAIVLIALAASIKIYPVFLLLILFAIKKYKYFFQGLLYSLAAIFLPFIFYPGNKVTTVIHFLNSFVGFADPSAESLTCRNSSFIGGLTRLAINFRIQTLSDLIINYSTFFSLTLLLIISILIMSKNSPLILKIFLGLSAFTNVPALTYSYTQNWTIAALCLILYYHEVNKGQTISKSLKQSNLLFFVSAALISFLIPWALIDNNYSATCGANFYPIIYSLITFAVLGTLLFRDARMRAKSNLVNNESNSGMV